MKKITLSLAAIALSAMSFAALNPFAYGLKSELSVDKSKVTVSYSLNADATSVKVVILDGETAVKTVESDKLVKGVHSLEIPTTGLESNKDYTWKVEVTGAEVTAPTEHPTNYDFYHPSAIDIDNNPENATFGLILCNEGMQSVKGINQSDTGEPYISTEMGAGIYAFNPAFEPMPNGDKPGYNGGIEFTNGRADAPSSTAYAPRRIRISDDGRIFVTSLNTNGTYLWELNPENLDEWTPIFEGANVNENFEVVDADGNFIAAPNVGFDVRGEGEDLQLLMLSASKSGFPSTYSQAAFQCYEYNLGTNTAWSTAPSKLIFERYAISYTSTQVQYDNEGGVWMCQYRDSPTELQPSLIHFNAAGEVDSQELVGYRMNGGIRFNNDFSKVIIAGIAEGTAKSKKATLYAVSKDDAGKPVLTQELVVDMKTVGNNLNDFAWDYAGNLYACGNSSEKLVAWAMPRKATDVVATPAAKKYVINLSATTFIENVEVINPAQKIIRNGQVLIIRDGKTYNMMGQEIR